MKTKWTDEVREFTLNEITKEFGPLHEWNGRTVPKVGSAQYNTRLKTIAECITLETGKRVSLGGVRNQMDWILSKGKIAPAHYHALVENVLSAIRYNFIQPHKFNNKNNPDFKKSWWYMIYKYHVKNNLKQS